MISHESTTGRSSKGYVHVGYCATAEEAALCVARSSEEQAMAERVASAAPPLTGEEAQQQARDAIIRAVALDII